MGDIPLEKMGYLLCETKYGSDFSVSGSRNIEEFDSVYEKIKNKLQMPKKIQKMRKAFTFLRAIASIFWNFLEELTIFFNFFVNGIKFLDISTISLT